MRRAFVALAIVFLFVSVSHAGWTVINMGTKYLMQSINNKGEVVGWNQYYYDGKLTTFSANFDDINIKDINNKGQVCGWLGRDVDERRGFEGRIVNGQLIIDVEYLPPGDGCYIPKAINDNGETVGTHINLSRGWHDFNYTDISNSEHVVGWLNYDIPWSSVYGVLDLLSEWDEGFPRAVNESGVIVGDGELNGVHTPLIWVNGQCSALGRKQGQILDINENGWFCGHTEGLGALWKGTGDPVIFEWLMFIEAINDYGDLVAVDHNGNMILLINNDNTEIVEPEPTPEPEPQNSGETTSSNSGGGGGGGGGGGCFISSIYPN